MTRERLKEIAQFLGVGLAATILDYTLLNVFAVLLGLPVLLANSISAPISSFISYKLNKHVVFEDRMHGKRKTLFLYVLILGVGILIIQNLMLHIARDTFSPAAADLVRPLLELIGLDGLSQATISINIAKMFGSLFSAGWNYYMLRRFVFVTSEEVKNN